MSGASDKRLIEDYLPIQVVGKEAVTKGHPFAIHYWWARRPLASARAAVYTALVPSSRWADLDQIRPFVEKLCRFPTEDTVITQGHQHILQAHAERLSRDTGEHISEDDIKSGKAPRPRVLDMFAGFGSIPLEALRLGCETYALDLNPVAHIIQLCTLVYPEKYGRPNPASNGSAADGTWAGLAAEVEHWGEWVLARVKAEIGDLYPPIQAHAAPVEGAETESRGLLPFAEADRSRIRPSDRSLNPVAYLWTRTVRCKNPSCGAIVPLVKQTWLRNKVGNYAALKVVADSDKATPKRARFKVVEARTKAELGFDPSEFSAAGNATCPFCNTVADSPHVKAEGMAGRMGRQLMAVACSRRGERGKKYFSPDELPNAIIDDDAIKARIERLCQRTGLSMPTEPIINDAKGALFCVMYGLTTWGDYFTPRQSLCLLSFVDAIHQVEQHLSAYEKDHRLAVVTTLAAMIDRLADYSSTGCHWHYTKGERTTNTFSLGALPMLWDFAESAPFNEENAGWPVALKWIIPAINKIRFGNSGIVGRGTATKLPFEADFFDAVITDPPYYDNVPYADISDYFYVWLKRSIGHLYTDHFGSESTPKKNEAVADATRHKGDKRKAKAAYEEMMARAFAEAHRVLKPDGVFVTVYAHKTTLGWATLVDALRKSNFTVTEAWPLHTEKAGRMRAQESAALASSIFLVARKRLMSGAGSYESEVQPELESIVRERVETLWDQGISGADLVIACVGAGLRAFTRFARVEYANGDEVPAERFLTEVESVVLDTILGRLSKEVGGNGGKTSLAGVDPVTRFYTLWRYTYRGGELDAGEAIIFANGTHVELDGPNGLSSGSRAVVEKKKGKYRLRDFTERGDDDELGLPTESGQPAPLVDILHRTLWLMENRPLEMAEFLKSSDVNRDQMRLVAQALAGPALKGGEMADISPTAEMAALGKLTANWRSVVEDNVVSQSEQLDRKRGQAKLFE